MRENLDLFINDVNDVLVLQAPPKGLETGYMSIVTRQVYA